jgi:DNA-binding NarL/FixJ family response regulator
MSKTKIRALLVEDSRIVARFLTESLELEAESNIEIVHAECMADAAKVLKKQEFDVVLLDLSLPDSAGMETIVRARALSPQTPILVLSSADDEAIRTEAVRRGAKAYLVKGDASGAMIMEAVHQAIADRSVAKRDAGAGLAE